MHRFWRGKAALQVPLKCGSRRFGPYCTFNILKLLSQMLFIFHRVYWLWGPYIQWYLVSLPPQKFAYPCCTTRLKIYKLCLYAGLQGHSILINIRENRYTGSEAQCWIRHHTTSKQHFCMARRFFLGNQEAQIIIESFTNRIWQKQ
jgi:hypothetical protein